MKMKITQKITELPFDENALVPITTEETFDYHYGKQQQNWRRYREA